LECFASNENHISAWCYSDPPNTPWILSCVYGPPDRRDRIAFWESFSSVGKNFVGSWLCLGDFNSVLDQTEKFGGRPVVSSSNCPFRNFIDIFGMVDLGFTGNQYTWSNNRQGNCIIKERLDRGLASSSWVHLFPEYSLLHIPAFSSDHHPILLNTSGSPLFLPRPFKFEEFWTKDPTCGQVIDAAWQVAVSGNPAFCLVKKLKHTKAALRRWNSLYFGNIQNRIKSTLISIDKVQCGPASLNSSVLESQLKLELEDLLVKEEIYWRNKSRETWLTCNDLNTKYFHTSTLIKRRSNAVDFLKSDSGVWLSDRPAIGGQFVTHFSNLFSTSNPTIDEDLLNLFFATISDDDNVILCSIPSEIEVVQALASLGSTKSPGPDGFTALFYKKYWSSVKDDVLSFVWNFFHGNHLLKEQNHTFIALVPKQSGSHTVHHFRPISLCNIVYKIITKILANRLKLLLPKIISPLQSAFVPARNIQDNVILAHELLHSFKNKKGKGGFMFLKLDMEKAFDKMEWSFLLAIMGKLGFHSTWINWIRICISSSSFSILINGSPFGDFSPGRGLRQGDPLSPFLFILGAEVFSRLMFKAETEGILKGLRIARNCPAINHLLFADDLLIFGRATNTEAKCIRACMENYTRWSGQSINFSKSSIHFSRNTNPNFILSITDILPFNNNPSRSVYLGLPFLFGNSKLGAFQGILDKIKLKVEGWRAKTLSQAGRLVLIKSVAAAIPSYAMSSFLLPISFCKQLDKLFKDFWWGFPPNKSHNLSLKSWDSLCLPKAVGGLGFRKMKDVNLALLSKLGWKLHTKANCMWVSQLRGKYLRTGSFLSPPLHSSASWFWKGVIQTRNLISQGACYKILRNSSLPIWTSPWVPSLPSFRPSPRNLSLPCSSHFLVRDLFTPSWDWNLSLLSSLFDQTSIREILKIKILPCSETEFLWTPSSNGCFSSASAFKLLSSSRSLSIIAHPSLSSTSWKHLWKLKLSDRLKLFLWKIAWDIIPTKARLNRIFPIPSNLICPLCSSEEDSLMHLFFRCTFARIAWRSSFWPLNSLAWAHLSLADWIKGILNPSLSFGIPPQDTHLF
jgi:hypothetical protein